jgi:RNA polymerase sigma factor (sigma-70 family)
VLRKGLVDRGPAAVASWRRKAARNRFLMHRRRAGREVSIDHLDAADAVFARDAGHDGGDAHLEALRRCLAELDDRSRTALTLKYGDGLSREEIATETGTTTLAVKALLQRARDRVRQCVSRRLSP